MANKPNKLALKRIIFHHIHGYKFTHIKLPTHNNIKIKKIQKTHITRIQNWLKSYYSSSTQQSKTLHNPKWDFKKVQAFDHSRIIIGKAKNKN